jgi:hypothetical protein
MHRRDFLKQTSALLLAATQSRGATSRTEVSIQADRFFINGRPTYQGRSYRGMKIEGLLMNSRMVQGIFDDLNPQTRDRWKYPDTGKWDADRNTREFIAAMSEWRRHGLLSFTINLQGGSPEGYSKEQPWHNSAFDEKGSLRSAYSLRLSKILDRADELGMIPIVGCFYFGQDQRLKDEGALKNAVSNTANWLLDKGYRNVILEISNECDNKSYDHAILRPDRLPELLQLAKSAQRGGRRLLVGPSFNGGRIPHPAVAAASDFLLLHGNGVTDPERIAEMVRQARQLPTYRRMPILFNEDDHFNFENPVNNMLKALEGYASWGYFDPGKSDYSDGYQCPPVNWGINSERKRAFFRLLKEVTGA